MHLGKEAFERFLVVLIETYDKIPKASIGLSSSESAFLRIIVVEVAVVFVECAIRADSSEGVL